VIVTIVACRNCNGTAHHWVMSEPTLLELRRIKRLTGLTARTLEPALNDGDPDAMAALLDLLHRRQNIIIPFDEIDLDFDGFDMKPDAEEEQAAKVKQAAAQAAGGPVGKPADPPPAPRPMPVPGPVPTAMTIPNGAPSTAESTAWSATTPPVSGGTSD
jgi:hypothetical protein